MNSKLHQTPDSKHITFKEAQGSIKLPNLWNPSTQTFLKEVEMGKNHRSRNLQHKGLIFLQNPPRRCSKEVPKLARLLFHNKGLLLPSKAKKNTKIS